MTMYYVTNRIRFLHRIHNWKSLPVTKYHFFEQLLAHVLTGKKLNLQVCNLNRLRIYTGVIPCLYSSQSTF